MNDKDVKISVLSLDGIIGPGFTFIPETNKMNKKTLFPVFFFLTLGNKGE